MKAADDKYYDNNGNLTKTVETDQPDRYFIESGGKYYQTEMAPAAGGAHNLIHDPAAYDRAAKALANSAPSCFGTCFYRESHEGGRLDFKHKLNSRALYNDGNGMYLHRDKVGNTAWGYYANNRHHIPESVALAGAQYQAKKQTGKPDDPRDQEAISRGYRIK